MGEIVNLRRARKAQGRRKDEQRAEENRLRFGLSKAEKQLAEKTNEIAERRIEGHRLDCPRRPEPDHEQ
jgi:hypothetical protein